MFDLGFWEILVIGAIALLVIGPERLPEVARTVGRWVGKVQKFVNTVKSDVDRELRTDELRKMMDSQKSELDQLKARLNSGADELNQDVSATGRKGDGAGKKGGGSSDDSPYLVRSPDSTDSDAAQSTTDGQGAKTPRDNSDSDGKGG